MDGDRHHTGHVADGAVVRGSDTSSVHVHGTHPRQRRLPCTTVGTHDLCQGILRLPGGDLYALTGPGDESQPAAIVGGTRGYAGARGQFTQIENPDGSGSWTVVLQR